ncbi:BCCT transporter family protein, partial [Vibrio parahaemolyticus AQ3810]
YSCGCCDGIWSGDIARLWRFTSSNRFELLVWCANDRHNSSRVDCSDHGIGADLGGCRP